MAKQAKVKDEQRKPITHENIYKVMLWVTYIVAGAFLVINLVKLNVPGIISIGGSLVLFSGVLLFMRKMGIRMYTKEFVVSVGLELIIFAISLFSGESYSDDFPMFLACIGMAGMYMEPKFTKIQIIIADVLLAAMYVISPAKGGALGQYILCYAIFTLAGFLFHLTIKRGRAFIDISGRHATEADNLLWTMHEMGEKLERDFNKSSESIEASTRGLEQGSVVVINSAGEVSERCGDVQKTIHAAGTQIQSLNSRVRGFEESLAENTGNMEAMMTQLHNVSEIIERTSSAVTEMREQMTEVAEIAERLGEISFKTTLLSLNAAVEAAHAGAAGAGFAVVAGEMKELSENSERFSEQVAEVVGHLLGRVERISDQFSGSARALNRSETRMSELQQSFGQLTQQFEALYENIGEQTRSVEAVDEIFGQLNEKVSEMKQSSAENQSTVEDIVKAMDDYRENIGRVIANTKVSV